MTLSTAATGEDLKQIGLDLVESHNPTFVETMRDYARQYCKIHLSVTSDDLRRYATSHGIKANHPNAWGAIFRGNEWRATGIEKSTLPSNHGRMIRRWELA